MRYLKYYAGWKLALQRLCMMGLLLLATACEKEDLGEGKLQSIQFYARVEALQNGDTEAKVYLENEEWIYWEVLDVISIGSNLTTTSHALGTLVRTTPGDLYEDFNGVFIAELPEASKYFLGMHPYNPKNVIRGSGSNSNPDFTNPVIDLCKTQPRRPDEKEDITFAKQVFPLVAWYGGEYVDTNDTPRNLDFHALAGIVRLELFNATAASSTVTSISIHALNDSPCRQLCGPFKVKGYKTNFPYLESSAGVEDSCYTVTLTFGSGLTFASDALKTFYLVLPAMSATGTSNYHLEMTVNATVGGTPKSFTKRFSVPVRRNGLTNMNALGVTDWNDATSISYGLSGHGTQERPFKVYTIDDLLYLRSCYNSTERKINGQPITEDTYITLMRSDIILTSANWHSSSINNFVGHFSDASPAPSHPGITNNSNIPLFQDISSTGHVSGLTVKSNGNFLTSSSEGVSPFCNINRGEIINCRIDNSTVSGVISAPYADIAGIAAQNMAGALIMGCECKANLSTSSSHLAGICLHNNGTISESYVTGTLTFSASQIGGICYNNQGTVMDCYFAATITGSTADWGGIVYNNTGSSSEVKHCYNSGAIATSATVGGIINSVSGGTVNYCWQAGPLQGYQVGGIIRNLSGGRVVNCYVNNSNANIIVTSSSSTRLGGGLVANLSGGSVENSFVHQISISGYGATLAGFVATLTGGNVRNSYSYEDYTNHFYGSTTLSGSTLDDALGVGTAPCYLVGGASQASITTISTSSSALSMLLANLNSHIPVDGSNWTDVPPVLGDYIVAKRFRPAK